MKRWDWVVAIALALCAATLAACGSNGSGDGDAAEREEAGIEFAACMREHGVEMPDPQPGQAGVVIGATKGPGGKASGINPDAPATEKAFAACEEKLGDLGGEISAEQEEEFKEQALAFSQCMREHGIEMPDPEFEGSGKVRMRVGSGDGPSPESPAFRQAQEACASEEPGGAGGAMPAMPSK